MSFSSVRSALIELLTLMSFTSHFFKYFTSHSLLLLYHRATALLKDSIIEMC